MPKLIFITGASSGIGQALALRFYQSGYVLALVARRTAEMQAWARQQGWDMGRYEIYGADVAVTEEILAVGQQCLQLQGVPDIVVANAGISQGVNTAIREDLQAMARTFAVNNIGLAASFHPFITPMVQRGSGTLVGMGSVAGIRGLPGHGAYCASKAAVISYCESLRGELRGSGVKVVTICPGYVDTPLTRKNAYPMPFLMDAADFAAKAVKAIEAGTTYQTIPWQMAWVSKLLRLVPNALFDKLVQGQPRKHRGQ